MGEKKERRYVTQRELEEIEERVKLNLPVAPFLVRRLLTEREDWIQRALSRATQEGRDG